MRLMIHHWEGGKLVRIYSHKRIAELCRQNKTRQQIADEIGCSKRTVQRVLNERIDKLR